MLCGVGPTGAESYNQLMDRVITGDHTWRRLLGRDLPEALEQIIVRAMALEPADRPSSAHELEAALMPFCRPVFRDAATGRLSAPGLPFRSPSGPRADALVPATAPGRPGAGDPGRNPATERNTHTPWPPATGPGLPSVPGASGVSGVGAPVPAVGTDPARRSRSAVFVLGL